MVPPALIVVSSAAVPALEAAGAAALPPPSAGPREPWDLVEEEAIGGDGKGVALAPEEEGGLEGIEKEVDFAALTGRTPPAAPAEGAVPAPPPKKRGRKREFSPVGRLIGIVVGGLLSLPFVYLIGSYFKEDIDNGKYGLHLFHNPPNVQEEVTDTETPPAPSAPKPEPRAKAAPAPSAENAEPQATAKPAAENPQGSKPAPAAGPGPKAPARTPPAKTVANAKAGSEEPPDLPEKIDLEAEPKDPLAFPKEKLDPFLPPATAFQPVRVGPAKKGLEPEAKAEPPVKPEPVVVASANVVKPPERPETPAAEPIRPRGAPVYTAADLEQALEDVRAVYGCPACSSTGTVLRDGKEVPCDACKGKPWERLNEEAYEKLRRLADVITLGKGHIGDDFPAPVFFQRVAHSPPALQRVTEAAKRVLEDPGKAQGGILLIGAVAKVAEKNRLYGAALKTDAAPGAVMLLSFGHTDFKENDRVLVAGSIVHEPARNIAGYTGSQQYVIWVGATYKLP
jgi:hypothetical protein